MKESRPFAQNLCVLAVGSNIDPETNIPASREILSDEHEWVAASELRWTAPVGLRDQPDFLNGAFAVRTAMDRDDFNAYLKSVEQRLGRIKGPIKSGPRTIDLDIVLWNGQVVHEDFHKAPYVREPVDELVAMLGLRIS